MSGRKHVPILLLFIVAGCSTGPERAPAIGEAFVGPISLTIRQDLTPRAPAVASLKHGERVEIVLIRRRFVRVRNSAGIEGWTDARHLLTPGQMAELDVMAKRYAQAPSQGSASVYEPVNAHTAANRGSPSFYQIREGMRVEVVAHELAPRVPFQPPALVAAPPVKAAPPAHKKKDREERLPPPPLPRAPAVPDNWLELSKRAMPEPESDEPDDHEEAPPKTPAPVKTSASVRAPAPLPRDDWSLIRTPEGKVGWVLTRLLMMGIPDEVAQYAEGHRITSYFSLGEVRDGEEVKHNWVWTTIDGGLKPYEFDGFRVFSYVRSRHRYETTYRERNLRGYYPGSAQTVEITMRDKPVPMPGFSLVIEDKDGRRYKRTYVYEGHRVRLVSKAPWQPPTDASPGQSLTTSGSTPAPSWGSRWAQRISGWFRRR